MHAIIVQATLLTGLTIKDRLVALIDFLKLYEFTVQTVEHSSTDEFESRSRLEQIKHPK